LKARLGTQCSNGYHNGALVSLTGHRPKKATRKWRFLEAEKITSSLQQEQQRGQQQGLQQEQQQEQQVLQQQVLRLELGLLLFLPQATKAAANNVAKRSDFFMGVFPLIKTKTFQGVPDAKMNSNM